MPVDHGEMKYVVEWGPQLELGGTKSQTASARCGSAKGLPRNGASNRSCDDVHNYGPCRPKRA
eukprot:8929495-Pyramimonas_sp.AAC.1